MPIIRDNVSKLAYSGTESMMNNLEARLDAKLLEDINIGRAVMLFDPNAKKKIYWTHNLPGQMRIVEVSENRTLHIDNRWKYFDRIVFVSKWQQEQYSKHYKFSDNDLAKTTVLQNAIDPIPDHKKPDDKIRLIYTSVPERGLDLLYEAYNRIYTKYNIELQVFSSYQIYGWPTGDIVHRQLLDRVKSHPGIRYHSSVPNNIIREQLQRSHIFAYPSTFLETSCIALIEAMSAGCICVHPNIAALPETSGGHTNMYEYNRNRNIHIDMFEQELIRAVELVSSIDMTNQKKYIEDNYSWTKRIPEWIKFINELK